MASISEARRKVVVCTTGVDDAVVPCELLLALGVAPASCRVMDTPGRRLSTVTQGIPAVRQARHDGFCSSHRDFLFLQ